MEFSIDRMHQEKNGRRSGKTVDAVVDVIGKIMVTDNQRVAIIVPYMNRADNIMKTFYDVCINHFKEKPIRHGAYEFGIDGYSSKMVILSSQNPTKILGLLVEPTYDNG